MCSIQNSVPMLSYFQKQEPPDWSQVRKTLEEGHSLNIMDSNLLPEDDPDDPLSLEQKDLDREVS